MSNLTLSWIVMVLAFVLWFVREPSTPSHGNVLWLVIANQYILAAIIIGRIPDKDKK